MFYFAFNFSIYISKTDFNSCLFMCLCVYFCEVYSVYLDVCGSHQSALDPLDLGDSCGRTWIIWVLGREPSIFLKKQQAIFPSDPLSSPHLYLYKKNWCQCHNWLFLINQESSIWCGCVSYLCNDLKSIATLVCCHILFW